MNHPVLIVGGGLAGLLAARLLHKAGIGFLLLEARDRLGGRILSADASGQMSDDGFDLGPSWFWPGMQPAMGNIVDALGLPCFPQNSDGDVIFQRMSREAPQRYRGVRQEPQSMRLAGGTGAIVSALAAALPGECIRLGTRVARVALDGAAVEVGFVDATGVGQSVRAAHVLFALPPRLLEATVSFTPALDTATAGRWRGTPTWMAPHAKVFALYDRPFWRDAGLSGTAQSMVGPLVEIHDATTASGKAALFGFVGLSADEREAAGRDAIVAGAVRQLAGLFGPQAGTPRATLFKDWAADPLTATAKDRRTGGHPVPTDQPWVEGVWRDRISMAGSETSRAEPGYLAGALETSEHAVAAIVSGRTRSARPSRGRLKTGNRTMKSTYRAMQITTPGTLDLVERATPRPRAGEVLIEVEACGICGADVSDIEGADPSLQPPRVPGHEVVGRIVALGENVPSLWKLGQRVGIGRLGGHCNECVQCRQGQFHLCENQSLVGASCDGGYAEMMLARGTGLVSIPDELASEEAAPILCAGIATFNALRKSGAQPGDLIAILGIGGLGHMALQYARKMGFKVAAVGRGQDIAEDALKLGAHLYIDTEAEDAAARLKSMGGAKAIVTTVRNAEAASPLMHGLAPRGRLVLLGAGKDPLPLSAGHLVVGERSVLGSITGTPYENERTLDFSVLAGVRPQIETMPLEKAFEAYRKMKSSDVKFRMVLTMKEPIRAH
ncbi:hypothetical protein MesoLjLb_63110 [Mesorhizobium sp. L-8-3]|nr:hypothetical protein MesoLjLb_63110 [Mesorhizobium sp. L-8-3]